MAIPPSFEVVPMRLTGGLAVIGLTGLALPHAVILIGVVRVKGCSMFKQARGLKMAVIDCAKNDFPELQDCWFHEDLDNYLRLLTHDEVRDAIAWINQHVFDAALAEPGQRMNVTEAIRRVMPYSDWTGTPLMPLYERTGQDYDQAALLYGNLVCRVGIRRPETWCSFSQPVADDRHSRTYVLHERVASRVARQSR